jgi:hypothetical protein
MLNRPTASGTVKPVPAARAVTHLVSVSVKPNVVLNDVDRIVREGADGVVAEYRR